MSELLAHIRDIVKKDGPMSIASYMELALQHPEFGYYRHGDPFGASGDFITAPEISQMYGEMIGLWCADVWRNMDSPAKFALIELGPGRGTLLHDALRSTAKITGFHQAMDLCLMETSQTLGDMQLKKLANYLPRHVESLSDLPELPTIIIANEFFDALPIRQFVKTFQGWCERLVTVEGDHLAFTPWPLDPAFAFMIPEVLREAPVETVHEVSMPSLAYIRDIAQHVVKQHGAALIIDYGYVEAPGKATLQAVTNHKCIDVLKTPGKADLTAHVDFSALRKIASMQDAWVTEPIGQGEFLQTLGIELRAAQLKQRATPEQAKDIDSALHRLTDTSEMGTLFKVIAVASQQMTELPGF